MTTNRISGWFYVFAVALVIFVGAAFVLTELVKGGAQSPPPGQLSRVHQEAVGLGLFDSVDPTYAGNAYNRFFSARLVSTDTSAMQILYERLRKIGWHPYGGIERTGAQYYARLCKERMTAVIESRPGEGGVEVIVTFGWSAGSQRSLPGVCA